MNLLLVFISAATDTLQSYRQVFWKDGNVPGQMLYREEPHIHSMIELMGEISLYRSSMDPLKKEISVFLKDIFFVLPGEMFQTTGWLFGASKHKKPIQLWSWIKAHKSQTAVCHELRNLLTRVLARDAENNWTNSYIKWFCSLSYEEEKHLGRGVELTDLLFKLNSSPTLSPAPTIPLNDSWDHLGSPKLEGEKLLKETPSGQSSHGQSSSPSDSDENTLAPLENSPAVTEVITVASVDKDIK